MLAPPLRYILMSAFVIKRQLFQDFECTLVLILKDNGRYMPTVLLQSRSYIKRFMASCHGKHKEISTTILNGIFFFTIDLQPIQVTAMNNMFFTKIWLSISTSKRYVKTANRIVL